MEDEEWKQMEDLENVYEKGIACGFLQYDLWKEEDPCGMNVQWLKK